MATPAIVGNGPVAIALHGGAGSAPGEDYSTEIDHMRSLIDAGRRQLRSGAPALDVVIDTVRSLEISGLYIAGRGSSPNLAGDYELDACVVDGTTGRAGAVAALTGFQSPILVAREVMRRTPHVMLIGRGADEFARGAGMGPIVDPARWFTPACVNETMGRLEDGAHGTVGCVALDFSGRLAAATSTGGIFGKMPGRCGDTPIIGAGCWADSRVAVSCTGHGEYFMRAGAALQVAHRMRWNEQGLEQAARDTIEEIFAFGGNGGLIAMDGEGNAAMPFRSSGMKRAASRPDGTIFSSAF